jgi:hypothetical protein
MVEVKLVCGAACYTFPDISFPHCQLYRCRDYSAPLNVSFWWAIEVLVSLNSNESVLEDFTVLVTFAPRIHQAKDSVVRSYSGLDLFVYSNTLGIASRLYTVEQRHGIFHFASTHRKEIVRVDPQFLDPGTVGLLADRVPRR